jgi:hypothetical protein
MVRAEFSKKLINVHIIFIDQIIENPSKNFLLPGFTASFESFMMTL